MTQHSPRIYYVSSDRDTTVRIAMRVTYNKRDVQWFDTVKERRMGFQTIMDPSPEHFVFERVGDEGGGIYTFVPMTLALYNEKVKSHIIIPQEFSDEASMLAALARTKDVAW